MVILYGSFRKDSNRMDRLVIQPSEKSETNRRLFLAAFLGIIALSIGLRVYFLLTTERALDMDECIVGIMAIHVAEKGEKFVHLIGQDYGGGHALIAYLAAPLFGIFGPSDVALQSITMLFSILFVVVFIFIVAKMTSPEAGLLSGLLLSFLTPYLKLSFQVDGYIETLFFVSVSTIILMRLISGGTETPNRPRSGQYFSRLALLAVLGVSSGLALWSHEFALIFLLVLGIAGLIHIKKFRFAEIMIVSAGFLLGYSIKLNYMIHDNSAPSTFAQWVSFGGIGAYFHTLVEILVEKLPRFFSPQIYHYHDELRPYSLLMYLTCAVSCVYMLYLAVRGRRGGEKKIDTRLLILAGLPFYFLLLMPLFSRGPKFPRYFLPLAPFAAAAIAFAVVNLAGRGGYKRFAGIALLSFFLVLEIFGAADMRSCRYDSCENGKVYSELVGFLGGHNIKGIYTDFGTKWHVAFYSGERIAGSDFAFGNMPRYMEYEQRVGAIEKTTYVFPAGWRLAESLEKYMRCEDVLFKSKAIGRLRVDYDLSKPLRPQEWMGRRVLKKCEN